MLTNNRDRSVPPAPKRRLPALVGECFQPSRRVVEGSLAKLLFTCNATVLELRHAILLNSEYGHKLLHCCLLHSLLSQAILVREPRVHALLVLQSKNHQCKRMCT